MAGLTSAMTTLLGLAAALLIAFVAAATLTSPGHPLPSPASLYLSRAAQALSPRLAPASPHNRHGWPPLAQTTRAPGPQPLAGPPPHSQGPSVGSALEVLGLTFAVGGAAPDIPPPQYSASEMLVLGGSLAMCLGAGLALMLQRGVRRAVIAALALRGVLPLSEQKVCSVLLRVFVRGAGILPPFFLSSPGGGGTAISVMPLLKNFIT